jgi:hypothetical protein
MDPNYGSMQPNYGNMQQNYGGMQPNYGNMDFFQGLNHSNNPAYGFLNQAGNAVNNYYSPYTQYANNPQDFINSIYGSFQDSPVLQREREERLKGLTSRAAASGRINNPAYEEEYSDLAGGLMSDQMRRYLQDVMGERQLGFQASQGAASDIGNIYGSGAQLAGHDAQQKASDRRNLLSSLIQGATTLGGAALGGPIGGALGSGLSKWMGF